MDNGVELPLVSGGAFDLHTHSSASDGLLKPAELVKRAHSRVSGIALTDHDSTLGWAEALSAGDTLGFPVIPGLEFTTDFGQHEVHILAYFIETDHPALASALTRVADDRLARAREMVDKLNGLGIPLAWEAVRRQAPGAYIGRPHIVRALISSRLIRQSATDDFFREYLVSGAPAYVAHEEISTQQAVALTLAAGGVPVLAHPGRMLADTDLLPLLVSWGLGGIETYYPSHGPAEITNLIGLAGQYNLVITGGSDFHGDPNGSRLGDGSVNFNAVEELALRATGNAGTRFLQGER